MDEKNQKNQVEGQSSDNPEEYDEYNLANFKFFGQKDEPPKAPDHKTTKGKTPVDAAADTPDISDEYNIDVLKLDKVLEEETQKGKTKKNKKPKSKDFAFGISYRCYLLLHHCRRCCGLYYELYGPLDSGRFGRFETQFNLRRLYQGFKRKVYRIPKNSRR